jgi:[acyl-carrier-protein] S-malonyltransferase
MGEAGRKKPGGMLAVIGLDEKSVREVCLAADTRISNINSASQIVISGAEDNLAQAKRLAEARGARRVIPLKVSGAFHSHLMEPAVDGLTIAISGLTFQKPSVPLVANVTGKTLIDAKAIKQELIDQLLNCVQWQQSIENMIAAGVTTFFEIGPGQVLTGLIKRINPGVQVLNICDAETISKTVTEPVIFCVGVRY